MFKRVLILFFLSMISVTIDAQSNLLNAKTVEQIGKKNKKSFKK